MAKKKKDNGGVSLTAIATIITILVGGIAIYSFFFKGPSALVSVVQKTGDINVEVSPNIEVNPNITVNPNIVVSPKFSVLSLSSAERPVFTLPSGQENLIGREEDIVRVVNLLKQGKDVLISGVPGMMQRETALAAARRLQREGLFPDGVLFHEAGEGHGEIDLMDALFLQLGELEYLKP